jgi:serine/threonine protein phosphatase 1
LGLVGMFELFGSDSRVSLAGIFNKIRRSKRPSVELAAANIPDDQRIYVIGDIHGRADLLRQLLNRIKTERNSGPDNQLMVFLGDYIDRGLHSKTVLDQLTERKIGIDSVFLMGNHEEAMLSFMEDPIGGADWLQFGGDATLLSYGVGLEPGVHTAARLREARDALVLALPPEHDKFLRRLKDSYSLGDYFFVHAAISPGKDLENQDPKVLKWGSQAFLEHKGLFNKVIVHGHTITTEPLFLRNRISLDTGAYYSGKLTCLILEGKLKQLYQ